MTWRRLMTLEQGKPLAESRGGGRLRRVVHRVVRRRSQARVRRHDPLARSATSASSSSRKPIGVVGCITPWNFPHRDDHAQGRARRSPPAARSCQSRRRRRRSRRWRSPSSAERAGVPKGVLNVVTGAAAEIGGELTSNPTVRKISFTGSTEVGKLLMAQCATTVKKVSLELGGNAPFIVFDDADLDAAVEGAIVSKYRNTGQTCVCANRFLVQALGLRRLRGAAGDAPSIGSSPASGLEEGVTQGPLIDDDGRRESRKPHSRRRFEGRDGRDRRQRHARGGRFFAPTVADRRHARHGRRARGDVRTGRAALPLRRPKRTRSRWPTTRSSASPPTSTAATSGASGASPRRSSTASSASTPA